MGKKLKRLKAKKACTGRMTLYITLFVALNYVLPSSLVERNMDLEKNSKKKKGKSERNGDDVAKPIIFHLQRAAC